MAQSIQNLPIGAKIKFGKHSINNETPQSIIWLIADKNHSGFPEKAITLITEKIIDMRSYDTVETNGVFPHTSYGNPYYHLSTIDQWLNKAYGDGEWFTPSHLADEKPTSSNTQNGTQYGDRSGFLHYFTSDEIGAILLSNIVDITGDTITRRVFLPSLKEIIGSNAVFGSSSPDSQFALFSNGYTTTTQITQQCSTYSLSTPKPNTTSNWSYLTRSYNTNADIYIASTTTGQYSNTQPRVGYHGIRPCVNLNGYYLVSDTTDSDGCYTLVYNSAPPQPNSLTVQQPIGANKTTYISWGAVLDPNGDTVTYDLECAYDEGSYRTIYVGTDTHYYHTVGEYSNVRYRVKAFDTYMAESSYLTSSLYTIEGNNAPVISGSDENLGTKTESFSVSYSITDADYDEITVVESIDGVQLRSFVTELDKINYIDIHSTTWLKLSNGVHTITITATDGFATSKRTYTFIKNVDSLYIVTSPDSTTTQNKPTRVILTINRSIPVGATFKVEVCNNGWDGSNIKWEDCTSAVLSGLVYVFKNTTKTADAWSVCIKITVSRNGSDGACYISSIGGNFE